MPNKIKVGQIWENFLGQTFEIKKIKGDMLYGVGRSRQGTPNNVIEHYTKKDLLEACRLKKNILKQ